MAVTSMDQASSDGGREGTEPHPFMNGTSNSSFDNSLNMLFQGLIRYHGE